MSQGLNICFVADDFPPMIGGRPWRIYNTAKQLAKENEVHVYCPRYLNAPLNEIIEGIHVHRRGFPVSSITSYPIRFFDSLIIGYELLKGNFDIVNVNLLLSSSFNGFTTRIKGTPAVFTNDGLLWHLVFKKGLQGYGFAMASLGYFLEVVSIKGRYDAYIAVSSALREELVLMGVPRGKIYVVPNGVDLNFIDSIRQVGNIKKPVICYVGRLEARKNIIDLIKAFKMVSNEKPHAKLIVIGTGPLLRKAVKVTVSLGLSNNVVFKGEVNYEEVIRTIKSSDCLVLPSLQEGFGIVLIEAMACCKPVVAYDIPQVRDAVRDGVNGFLVPPRNVKLLAERIISLLENEDLRREMGLMGRRIVEKQFTWEKVAEKTLRIYESVLEESKFSK